MRETRVQFPVGEYLLASAGGRARFGGAGGRGDVPATLALPLVRRAGVWVEIRALGGRGWKRAAVEDAGAARGRAGAAAAREFLGGSGTGGIETLCLCG